MPEPYDATFNKKKTCPIGVYELMVQAEARGLNKYDRIIVLGGKNYVSILSKVFEGKIEGPVAGLSGMGEIMKNTKERMYRPIIDLARGIVSN